MRINSAQALEDFLADASDAGSVAFRFASEVQGGHEVILAADNEVQAVLNEFTDVSVSNAMRAALLTVITSNYFFTAAQAQLLLGTFDVGFEQTQVSGAALPLGASVAFRAIACLSFRRRPRRRRGGNNLRPGWSKHVSFGGVWPPFDAARILQRVEFRAPPLASSTKTLSDGFRGEQAAVNLFMRTVDTDALVAAIDKMSEAARFNIQHALGERSLFRYMNPTGHYRLDLSKPADRLLTGTLKVRLCTRPGARSKTRLAAGRVRAAVPLSYCAEFIAPPSHCTGSASSVGRSGVAAHTSAHRWARHALALCRSC